MQDESRTGDHQMVSIPVTVQRVIAGIGTFARRVHSPNQKTQWVAAAVITVVAATAMLAMCAATPSLAADDAGGSLATKLPDNEDGDQLYLIMLKKNELSIRVSPELFCRDLGYGHAVTLPLPLPPPSPPPPPKNSDAQKDDFVQDGFWDVSAFGTDGKKPGNINWVICKFTPKFTAKPQPK
jgi:hypothetical protein